MKYAIYIVGRGYVVPKDGQITWSVTSFPLMSKNVAAYYLLKVSGQRLPLYVDTEDRRTVLYLADWYPYGAYMKEIFNFLSRM